MTAMIRELLVLTVCSDHPWSERIGEDTGEVVHESTNGDGLVPHLSGWRLGDNGVTSRTDRDHVDKRRDDQEDTNGELGGST